MSALNTLQSFLLRWLMNVGFDFSVGMEEPLKVG